MLALSVSSLTKVYRNGVRALDGIDFDVPEGDFVALLGPNGAGKTTLIGIVTSLVNRTAGEVRVFDYELSRHPDQAKSCIGVVPQEVNLNQFETLQNILVTQAGFYGLPMRRAKQRAEACLRQLELWDRRTDIARNLSGGMKRRLMIARALVHEPRLLILDEPTAGVDIEIRRSMWDFLRELNESGTTIILTTHYLEEAETLCRNLAIIDHGRLIEYDRMTSILRKLQEETLVLTLREPIQSLPTVEGFEVKLMSDHEIVVSVSRERALNDLFDALSRAGLTIISMRNQANRLEQMFVRLTGPAPVSAQAAAP